MKVPLSWLREFVPVEAPVDELAERLSLSGLAVEEIIRTGEGISGVVVGEVRAVREHPNADNLMLVRAYDGSIERNIVCGARNYVVGDRVPLALPGARLPGGMEIGERKVRGEVSQGMMCSARELRLSEDHTGIMVLDADAPLGADLVRALELDDVVLHLDVTTNRGDCLSIVGVAREVAALYRLPLTVPQPVLDESAVAASERATVRIEDARGCPRYLARVVENVTVGPSPWWMRRRIIAAGMRPISNVVDVTNYVLLERGQPLHAFDLSTLASATIVVRKPRRGERIATLDGQERALERDDLVIADAERPVAVAGVMGGADTEVSDKTTSLLLEAAYFEPLRIRRTAARLKLRSEASMRFERGADPEAVPAAAARAAELLARVAGGTVLRGAIDVYPRPFKPRTVRLRAARANALLGIDEPAAEMASALASLGCEVETSRTVLRVTTPSWRPDLQIEEDLVEEVARLHGYWRIPETLPEGARAGGLTPQQRRARLARRLLLGAGLSEAQTLSLLPPWVPDRFGFGDDHPMRAAARVGNPLSAEESVLRDAIRPGLLLAAQRNVARRVLPVRLFEMGTVFARSGSGVDEEARVAWLMTGPAPGGWHTGDRALDFYDASGALAYVLDGLGIAYRLEQFAGEPGFHPGRTARVYVNEEVVGIVGELLPEVAEAFELPARVAVAELSLAPLLAEPPVDATAPPRLPAVARDVALVVPAEVPAAEVAATIRAAAGGLLGSLDLFDVYRGEQLGEGKVSLAYALTLRDPERTLTDEDADAAMTRIAEAARARAWTVRE
jgi:phenylalanyl-tRNA synthetase beta chain